MSYSTPRVMVTLDDGTEHDVQTNNGDAVRWDVSRARKQWPKTEDAPILWTTFLAWSALKRQGIDLGDPESAMQDRIVSVEFLKADGTRTSDPDEVAATDPTLPGQ